jgi:hypothetical protein
MRLISKRRKKIQKSEQIAPVVTRYGNKGIFLIKGGREP